ncbi:MAG: Hsp33 family molecular chaperone HslO [Streptococcus sp.]
MKNASKRCQPFQRFWSLMTISKRSLHAIYGDEPFKRLSEEELSFECDCSRERFENALLTLR